MITKCVELGKRKCSQYWPETVEAGSVNHGHVTVQLVKTFNAEGYDIHSLKVSCQVSPASRLLCNFLLAVGIKGQLPAVGIGHPGNRGPVWGQVYSCNYVVDDCMYVEFHFRIVVHLLRNFSSSPFAVFSFTHTHTHTHTHTQGTERTLIHYQFLAWPDYGVPTSGQHVLQLLFSARKAQSRIIQQLDLPKLHLPSHGPPLLVHCSAGVGRSGAFCTLDICVDELSDKNRVNLQGIVRRMRRERAYSVQTDEQYEFCYRTVLECAKSVS